MSLEQAFTTLFDSSGVEVGTAGNPLRIDPTGGTEQPVSQGTAAAVAGSWPILVTDGVDTAEVVTSAPGGGAAGLVVRVAGSVTTSIAQPSTGTITSVAVSTVSATALAANASRLGAAFWNEGANTVYLKLGATASTVSYTVRIGLNSFYELSFPAYTGIIDVITNAAAATLLVTELT
jgi:hypothetical protein